MIPVELTMWILILTGIIGLANVVLLAVIIRLLYRGLDIERDVLNQIRHFNNAQGGVLELEDED